MLKNSLILFSFVCLSFVCSCQTSSNGQQKSKDTSTITSNFSYDLNKAKTYKLNSALDEISGIAFHPQKSDKIYAIQDEHGKLFTYDLAKEKIVDEFSFGKNGDYEDVATDGKFFYVLKSNGDIFYFPFDYQKVASKVQVAKDILPKGEYESLAVNPLNKTLQVLCKECKVDKSLGKLSGYSFQLQVDGSLSTTYNTFSIELNSLKTLDSGIGKSIKPSAMAFNPQSQEWYIISSIDKILIVTDTVFQPKNVIAFKRSQFEQPEGLAFNNTGELFISSEIGDANSAAIYQFNLN